jgi:hypothetical protein
MDHQLQENSVTIEAVSQCQFRGSNAEWTRILKKSRSFARAQDDASAIFFDCDPSPLSPTKTWWRGDNFATFFKLIRDVDLMRIAARFTR